MSGELLGMDMDGVVEITESFPHPAGSQEESDVIEYQNEMIRTLKEAHVDQTLVGWYQCSSLESWLTPAFIDTQSLYQSNIPNSIILVIDVLRSSRGFPCVKAFRLKDEFIAMFREKRNKNPALQGNAEIFNELPVSLKLSSLDQLFLLQAVETNAIPVVGVPQVPEIDDLLLRIKGNSILSSTEDVLSEAGRLQHQIRNTVKQNQTFNSQLLRLVSNQWTFNLYFSRYTKTLSAFKLVREPSHQACSSILLALQWNHPAFRSSWRHPAYEWRSPPSLAASLNYRSSLVAASKIYIIYQFILSYRP